MSPCTHYWLLGRSRHDPDIKRVITDGRCKVCGKERRFVSKPVADWVGDIREPSFGKGRREKCPEASP